MLLTYANAELAKLKRDGEEGSRVVVVGEHFVSLVPYWAFWPYETLVIPYKSVALSESVLPRATR